jgi:hypothetical protein
MPLLYFIYWHLLLNSLWCLLCILPTSYLYLQGGALNRGLLFADPLPSPLGAVSGNISEN